MNTDRLLEISPSSIETGPIPFDLFLLRNDSLVLFCRKGLPITDSHIQVLERRLNPFYVKKKQWSNYVEYAEDALPLILADSCIETSYRSEVMHALSFKRLDRVLNSSKPEEAVEELVDLAECYINYLHDTPEAAIHLFKRSEEDDAILQRSINCATFNVMIGQKLMPNNKNLVQEFALAGMLHDIGMKYVEPSVVNKKGRLTEDEFDQVKQHCTRGADLLSKMDVSEGIVMSALSHHERFDGSGYLEGLTGNDIHPLARVTAISDVYDALTSDRPYASKKKHVSALMEMKELKHLFDGHMLGILADVVLRNERLIERYNHEGIFLDPADLTDDLSAQVAAGEA